MWKESIARRASSFWDTKVATKPMTVLIVGLILIVLVGAASGWYAKKKAHEELIRQLEAQAESYRIEMQEREKKWAAEVAVLQRDRKRLKERLTTYRNAKAKPAPKDDTELVQRFKSLGY